MPPKNVKKFQPKELEKPKAKEQAAPQAQVPATQEQAALSVLYQEARKARNWDCSPGDLDQLFQVLASAVNRLAELDRAQPVKDADVPVSPDIN